MSPRDRSPVRGSKRTHLDIVLSGYINKHPDAASIIAGDFNKANLRQVMPNFINIYSVQLEDRIHWIIATLRLKRPTMPAHYRLLANRTMPPFSSHWSSHSEAMLQAALDDVDWDMFRASSSDVSEFTDVAISFINTLTEQATETVTKRSNSQIRNCGWTEQSLN